MTIKIDEMTVDLMRYCIKRDKCNQCVFGEGIHTCTVFPYEKLTTMPKDEVRRLHSMLPTAQNQEAKADAGKLKITLVPRQCGCRKRVAAPESCGVQLGLFVRNGEGGEGMTIEEVARANGLISKMKNRDKIDRDLELVMKYDTKNLALEVRAGGANGRLLFAMDPCPMIPEILQRLRDDNLKEYEELERELDQM